MSDGAAGGFWDVRLDECLAMAEGKTGALLGAACALGALLGGQPRPLSRPGTAGAARLSARTAGKTDCAAASPHVGEPIAHDPRRTDVR